MKFLKELEPAGKKILVRLDLDVPVENGKVVDGFRIDVAIPTLKFLATAKKLYLIGHAGRPQPIVGNWRGKPNGKVVEELRLKPQAQYLAQALGLEFQEKPDEFLGPHYYLGENIEILENLRFDSGEETNDSQFAQKLANFAEAFVFEAFAVSHRKHASIYALSKLLPTYIGLRCQKEMEVLSKLRKESKETIILVGGAKVEDKSEIIQNYQAQKVLFGGKTASQVWQNKEKYKEERFVLPIDGVLENGVVKNYADLSVEELNLIRDIGPQTIENYSEIIKTLGKNIIFAGPMGQYEKKEFSRGTKELMEVAIKTQKNTVVLGGDSAAAAEAFNSASKISYISVGGGASLNFLVTGETVLN
jgi:phosphoglycerate kinase